MPPAVFPSQLGDEAGQSAVEMGIILLLMLMMTAGIFDASRGFYQYTDVSAAARYGVRWGSVVGGTCSSPNGASVTDWCNQVGGTSSSFWSQPGNVPAQSAGTSCPTSYQSGFSGYYKASDYLGGTTTTIVGAIAHHFDTSSQSTNFILGSLTPGFDLGQLLVCIQLDYDTTRSQWATSSGDKLRVYVYYPFKPITALLTPLSSIYLTSSATMRID